MAPPSLLADPLRRGPADILQAIFGLKSWGPSVVVGSSQAADAGNTSGSLAMVQRDLSTGGIAGVSVGSIVGVSIVFFIAYPFVARTVRLGWNRWKKAREKAKKRDSSPSSPSENAPALGSDSGSEASVDGAAHHPAQSSCPPDDISNDSSNSNGSGSHEQTRSLSSQLNSDEPAPNPNDEPSNAPTDYPTPTNGLNATYYSLDIPNSAFGLENTDTNGPQDPGMFEIRAAGDESPKRDSSLFSTMRKFAQGLRSGSGANENTANNGNASHITSQKLTESPVLASANVFETQGSRSLGANDGNNNIFQNTGTINPTALVGPGGLTESEHMWRFNMGLDQSTGAASSSASPTVSAGTGTAAAATDSVNAGDSAAAAAAAAKAKAETDAFAELVEVAQKQGISIDSLNLSGLGAENGSMSVSGLNVCGVDQQGVAAPAVDVNAYNSNNSGGFGSKSSVTAGYSGPNSALAEGYSASLQHDSSNSGIPSAQPPQQGGLVPSQNLVNSYANYTHPQGVSAQTIGQGFLASDYDVEASNSLVPPSSKMNGFPSPISMATAASPDTFSEDFLNTTKSPQLNLTSSSNNSNQQISLQQQQQQQLQLQQAGLLPLSTSATTTTPTTTATANLDLNSILQSQQSSLQQRLPHPLFEVSNQPQLSQSQAVQSQSQPQPQLQLWRQHQQQASASSAAPPSEFLPSPPQANGDQFMDTSYAQFYPPQFILGQSGTYQSFVDMNNMSANSSAMMYNQPRISVRYGQLSQHMMMGNIPIDAPLNSDFVLADFIQQQQQQPAQQQPQQQQQPAQQQPQQQNMPYGGHRYTISNTSTEYHPGLSSPYHLASPAAPSIVNTPETRISATPSPRVYPMSDMTSPYSFMPHSSPVPAPLKCEQCGREFDQAHKLNHHKRYHERPHECKHDNCGKRFGTKTHLERHINDKHKQTRKYHCTEQGCAYSRAGGKGFPRKDNWRRHMSNIHGCSPGSNIQADVVDESDKM